MLSYLIFNVLRSPAPIILYLTTKVKNVVLKYGFWWLNLATKKVLMSKNDHFSSKQNKFDIVLFHATSLAIVTFYDFCSYPHVSYKGQICYNKGHTTSTGIKYEGVRKSTTRKSLRIIIISFYINNR
jgi:hypothetical protein